MHFLLKKQLNAGTKEISIVTECPELDEKDFLWCSDIKTYTDPEDNRRIIIVLGDLINGEKDTSFGDIARKISSNTIYEFGGFFYVLFIDNNTGNISIYNSIFGILPIYYFLKENTVLVSSSMEKIKDFTGKRFEIEKQYLLERLLFNYGFAGRTYYKDIRLVPANHSFIVDSKLDIAKIFDVTDLFTSNPTKGKYALQDAAQSLIHHSKKYFPDDRFAISFTGGFDGRTLLSTAKHYHKNFFSYSFGTKLSDDLTLPMEQSKQLNIEFMPIYLEDDYVFNDSLNCGRDLIMLAEGYAAFARAHYVFAAKLLAAKIHYIITGNFGSELLRALHNPGVVLSKELIDIFSSDKEKEISSIVNQSAKLQFVHKNSFKPEIESLTQELIEYKVRVKNFTKNEAFYNFVLCEVFRKYFGPEIVMQSNFLVNRSPFLDYNFIKELFKTYYAGVYSEYFTHNPVKRYKGQLLYAEIIKKTSPALLNFKTIRGYSPKALLSNFGKVSLVVNHLNKTIKKNVVNESDPFAVKKAFSYNRNYWEMTDIIENFYDRDYLKRHVKDPGSRLDLLINIISVNHYLSSNQK